MNSRPTIYRAALTYLNGSFEPDVALLCEEGVITKILRGQSGEAPSAEVVDLGEVALIPGQINVHSHAFQRSLRGRTEYRDRSRPEDDFWTWRREMYRLANRIGPEDVETIAEMCFLEMIACGITRVGEFHYVHHDRDGQPFAERNELALRIARAAQRVGMGLTLLPVAYHTGDINEPALREQRRFLSPDVETYLAQVEVLEERVLSMKGVDVGVAPHSIRAVPKEWMEQIAQWARARGKVVHIHVCEQRKEVERSREVYGVPPVEALHRWGVLDENWTLIHATHLSERELEILEEVRPTVGACPTTERNLGDGFLPAFELVKRGVPIALGSDSHTVIDPFEEMRLVEYHERLQREERNVLVAAGGVAGGAGEGGLDTAQLLFPLGTIWGARSLQSAGGSIEEGRAADFVALSLTSLELAGASRQSLLTDVVLSMSSRAVSDVVVAGRQVLQKGRHEQDEAIVSKYRAMMRTLAEE